MLSLSPLGRRGLAPLQLLTYSAFSLKHLTHCNTVTLIHSLLSHLSSPHPHASLNPSSYFYPHTSLSSSYSVHTSLYTHSPPSPPLPGSQGSLSAPRYIKSKASSSDQHMDDLCRRVAAQALSDDPLDGMSISLSGRSSVRM